MKTASTLQSMFASFYSRDFYRQVALERGDTGLVYLLILTSAALVPLMIDVHLRVEQWVREEALPVTRQLPAMTISNGVLSVPGATSAPVAIYGVNATRPSVVIDPDGRFESPRAADSILLVSSNKISMQLSNGNQTDLVRFHGAASRSYDGKKVSNFMVLAGRFLSAVFYLPFLAMLFTYRCAVALCCASLVGAFRLSNAKLPFRTLFRLAAVALTPSVVIGTIMSIAGTIPLGALGDFMLTFGFTFFGAKAALTPVQREQAGRE